MKNTCKNCDKFLNRKDQKYCNPQCQNDFQRKEKIEKWLKGDINGMKGKTSTAKWIKWYLIQLFGEKCMECNWNEKNPTTGNIPIELEHIDGDYTNNKIDNLKLLCPNCHSLTPTYKGANKKIGRPRKKYYRGL